MSFFGLFGKKSGRAETVVCIEIGPDTIAGGYVYLKPGERPLLVHSISAAIEPLENETPETATARTMGALGEELLRDAAPKLVRISGSGTIHSILVSVKAPWQETTIRSEKIERTSPILFTRQMLDMALAKSGEPPHGRLLADEFTIGTILDGYTVSSAIGKRASRINIIVLSSFIDERLSIAIAQELRKLFHTKEIRLVAAAAIRYEAVRAIFAHEQDYLTIDRTGNSLVIMLVRLGLLSAVEHTEVGNEEHALESALMSSFEAITKRYPLPRKLFLLAPPEEQTALKEKIEVLPLAKLRLSEDPLMVVSVTVGQLTDLVTVADGTVPHLGLESMAIFWRRAGE